MGCEETDNFEGELCENEKCFSITSFGESLDSRLGSSTLGYSYAIYYNNALKKWGQNGQARRPQNPPVFDINAISTDMNVASSAKSITCIATLQALQALSLGLNENIVDYLPQWWTFGPGVDQIKIKHLLAQQSGFRPPPGGGEDYVEIREEVATGISLNNLDVDDYQNMNFCILRIIIPILSGTFDKNVEQSDALSEAQTTAQFMAYMQSNIFDPLLIDVSCNNFHDVVYYNFSNPGASGFNPGEECNNAGGGTISLSSNDLAKTMYNAAYGNQLLGGVMQNAMFKAGDPLGCYDNNANGSQNWGTQFHHNGGFNVGGNGAAACWYIFHNDVVVAVSTNSVGGIPLNGYNDVNDLIEQAFDSAWTP